MSINDAAIDDSEGWFERCYFVSTGINSIRTATIHISNCVVDYKLKSWNGVNVSGGVFYVDSSTVHEVEFAGRGALYSTYSDILGSITKEFRGAVQLSHCTVFGIISTGIESYIAADSTILLGRLSALSEGTIELAHCLLAAGLSIAPAGMRPDVTLRNCTMLGEVAGSGSIHLRLDSSMVQWETPPLVDNWRLRAHCSNIISQGTIPWLGSPQILDTSNVISLNPLFCDTASGDYRIKDSSPCAPANNSCGVLIGAYGIGCANIAPELTSANSATVIKRTPFAYHATSSDIDGPSTIYSFANLPAWLSSEGDSVYGTSGLNDSDTDIIAIVSDGFLADSQMVHISLIETPLVGALLVDESGSPLHVISQSPKTEWSYLDPTGLYPQSAFEIGVSTDNDWQFAEMWNPAPFASADTFVVYNGAPLLDGQTYWLRLRVSNSLGWSNWSELMFRMNSVPTSPQLHLPANSSIVASQFPDLTVRNPIDAESDSMFLTFEISADSFATSFFPFQAAPSTDSLTTISVPVQLDENTCFWWRLKSSDYYEESVYSPIWSFWINSSNTAPSAFSLLNPPNAQSPTLPDNTPEFTWQSSFDFDPGDSVKFTLQLSFDSSFSFASQIPGLTNPQYVPTTPLEWGRRYWWRVKAEDNSTGQTWSNEVFNFTTMKLGDPDGSGVVTISDVVFIINFIFAGGQSPNPLASADADCNGLVTISDAVYLIQFIFAGGPAPCEA